MHEDRKRPAKKADSRRIAEFYRIASAGVSGYIWTKLADPGADKLDVGQRHYEGNGYCEMVREPVVPHTLIHHDGDAMLITEEIEAK